MEIGIRGSIQAPTLYKGLDTHQHSKNHKIRVFWVMDYDEACCMHLTPGVVHNFPKAVGV